MAYFQGLGVQKQESIKVIRFATSLSIILIHKCRANRIHPPTRKVLTQEMQKRCVQRLKPHDKYATTTLSIYLYRFVFSDAARCVSTWEGLFLPITQIIPQQIAITYIYTKNTIYQQTLLSLPGSYPQSASKLSPTSGKAIAKKPPIEKG